MADLPVKQTGWEVDAPPEVEKMWMEVRIQEYKSRVAKLKQMIEDVKKGQVTKLEADLKMTELSLEELKKNRDAIKV